MEIKFYSKDEEYYEFSNYSNSKFIIDYIEYPNVETFFQSEKFNDCSNKDMLTYKNLIINVDNIKEIDGIKFISNNDAINNGMDLP